jgi:hypothetical protein
MRCISFSTDTVRKCPWVVFHCSRTWMFVQLTASELYGQSQVSELLYRNLWSFLSLFFFFQKFLSSVGPRYRLSPHCYLYPSLPCYVYQLAWSPSDLVALRSWRNEKLRLFPSWCRYVEHNRDTNLQANNDLLLVLKTSCRLAVTASNWFLPSIASHSTCTLCGRFTMCGYWNYLSEATFFFTRFSYGIQLCYCNSFSEFVAYKCPLVHWSLCRFWLFMNQSHVSL